MTTESSAVVRLINSVQAQPIMESFTDMSIPDPGMGRQDSPPLSHDFNTVVVANPTTRRWPKYLIGGALLLGLAIGVGVVVGKSGGGPELAPKAAVVPSGADDADEAAEAAEAAEAVPSSAPVATDIVAGDVPAAAEPAVAGDAIDGLAAGETGAETDEAGGAEPMLAQNVADTATAAVAAAPAIEQAGAETYTSGVDIIVQPAGARVVLDGAEIGTSPLRVGRLAAGPHTLEILAPAGFVSQKLAVELGAAERKVVEVSLQSAGAPAPVAVGLVAEPLPDDEAEPEPAKSETRPAKRSKRSSKRSTRVAATRRETTSSKSKKSKATKSVGRDQGVLMLGAKPPCKIYIDGKNTGLTTPQRSIKLKAGKHKITLVNREHKIKVTTSVKIEAGKTKRLIKDLSKRIK